MSGPVTSAKNLSLNQLVSRRTSTRPLRSCRQQPALAELGAARLVEIFGDDRGARHRRMAFLDQHRRRAGRIEREEFVAALPYPLLDEPRRDAVLAEREPDEAGMRTERMMEQRQHSCALDHPLPASPLSRLGTTLRTRGARVARAQRGPGEEHIECTITCHCKTLGL